MPLPTGVHRNREHDRDRRGGLLCCSVFRQHRLDGHPYVNDKIHFDQVDAFQLGVTHATGLFEKHLQLTTQHGTRYVTKLEHVYQAQVQLGMVRAKTKYKPEYAVIAYTNASFFDDVVEFVVRYDSEIFIDAQKRAARIMTAHRAEETPATTATDRKWPIWSGPYDSRSHTLA